MPNTIENLREQIMQLSAAERANLLDSIIASIDVDKDAEAAWDQVADTRESQLDDDYVQAVSLQAMLTRLENRLNK